jgi:hypothetical protein
MIRWTPPTSAQRPQRWQSRAEILKAHLDSLSPDELRRVRPSYYWLRFGLPAWQRELARKYDPNQPRVPAGSADGGQWTSGDAAQNTQDDSLVSFAAAIRRGRSPVFCMAQYAADSLVCNSVEQSSKRACWAQAAERLGNCLSGRPIPPLNF